VCQGAVPRQLTAPHVATILRVRALGRVGCRGKEETPREAPGKRKARDLFARFLAPAVWGLIGSPSGGNRGKEGKTGEYSIVPRAGPTRPSVLTYRRRPCAR